MIKSFLITISFSILLHSSEQILFVVADDFNATNATMECYEGHRVVYKDIKVNLGKNGLGWGIGVQKVAHNLDEPIKREGDGRAPAGIFTLSDSFGYAHSPLTKNMPYLYADANLICVDEVNNPFYNQIIEANGDEKSFEFMRRLDMQYKYGVVVEHNPLAQKQRGSCIFLHIQKAKKHPTVGCTSMSEKDLKRVIKWLDKKKKPILIQLPKKYAKKILKEYPFLKESKLLK